MSEQFHRSADIEDGPDTPDEALDLLMHEAGWIDMHGGDHHEDDCPVCRSIAMVRAGLNHAYPPSHAGGTFNDAQSAQVTPGAALLKQCDELHDVGFNAGWNGAIEECAKLAERDRCTFECGDPGCTAARDIATAIRLIASHPSPAATVETVEVEEDDPDVLIVARAIAEHGFGRPWDDFHACDASDTDQGDLLEYGRAAVTALRARTCSSAATDGDWRDDPGADERWSAGCDFALEQLGKYLSIDLSSITWDGATETVEGDVEAVIGNILRAKYGENWGPDDTPTEPQAVPVWAPIETAPIGKKPNDQILVGFMGQFYWMCFVAFPNGPSTRSGMSHG